MVIRFQCPYCGKTLGVPEEKAGTQGTCPQCQNMILAPEAGEARETFSLGLSASTAGSSHGVLKFHCPNCGAIYERSMDQAGQQMTCTKCQTVWKIQ